MRVKQHNELARCSIPAYCLRSIGDRHILIAGGGGSAKTGVPNEIQVVIFLLLIDKIQRLFKAFLKSG